MRRFASLRNVVRALTVCGVLVASTALAASGCQAITGSYSVSAGLGPICTSLAGCCGRLVETEQGACLTTIALQNETNCAMLTASLGTVCLGIPVDSGLGLPDVHLPDVHLPDVVIPPSDVVHPGDVSVGDVVVHHDAPGSSDGTIPFDAPGNDGGPGDDGGGSPTDAAEDVSAEAALQGTWTLTDVLCSGSSLGAGSGSSTLSFMSNSANNIDTLTDGCVDTFNLDSVTYTSTTINAASSNVTCSSSCTSADGCTAVASEGAVSLGYTLSAGKLDIPQTAPTTECASGMITLVFTMD